MVDEIDELRTSIDGWQDDEGARLLARQMAIDMADRHLRSGTDVVVPQSVNKGAPVVLDAPRSGIAKSLEQLAARFLPAGAEPAKKRGLL